MRRTICHPAELYSKVYSILHPCWYRGPTFYIPTQKMTGGKWNNKCWHLVSNVVFSKIIFNDKRVFLASPIPNTARPHPTQKTKLHHHPIPAVAITPPLPPVTYLPPTPFLTLHTLPLPPPRKPLLGESIFKHDLLTKIFVTVINLPFLAVNFTSLTWL